MHHLVQVKNGYYCCMRAHQLTYIAPLDGWRAVAIILVLLHHFFGVLIPGYIPTGTGHWAKLALSVAWSGVDMFFILSGFLIGRILIVHKGGEHFFQHFIYAGLFAFCRRICSCFFALE
ncbi:MAG TPA: hypothetical protein VLC98_17565 [Phnomibacter sp.]|nr:hypothetical protein [Phnomibacter sp.]